jgi:hypothetical protein
MRSEWIADEGALQEYTLHIEADGIGTRHDIIGILTFGADGKLSGERIYASDELIQFHVRPAPRYGDSGMTISRCARASAYWRPCPKSGGTKNGGDPGWNRRRLLRYVVIGNRYRWSGRAACSRGRREPYFRCPV